MRKLNVVGTNVDTSDPTNYPWGKLKNKITGVQSGTLLTEEVFGDLLQAMYEVLRVAGIEPDGNPEKKEASQFSDAVALLGIRPVAILKCGYDLGTTTTKVQAGKYADGYSAEFVETSVSGDTTIYSKLTIKKDGEVSTENYFVSCELTSQTGGNAYPLHGAGAAPFAGYYFFNDIDANIAYIDPDGSAIADVRNSAQYIIKIYKAD